MNNYNRQSNNSSIKRNLDTKSFRSSFKDNHNVNNAGNIENNESPSTMRREYRKMIGIHGWFRSSSSNDNSKSELFEKYPSRLLTYQNEFKQKIFKDTFLANYEKLEKTLVDDDCRMYLYFIYLLMHGIKEECHFKKNVECRFLIAKLIEFVSQSPLGGKSRCDDNVNEMKELVFQSLFLVGEAIKHERLSNHKYVKAVVSICSKPQFNRAKYKLNIIDNNTSNAITIAARIRKLEEAWTSFSGQQITAGDILGEVGETIDESKKTGDVRKMRDVMEFKEVVIKPTLLPDKLNNHYYNIKNIFKNNNLKIQKNINETGGICYDIELRGESNQEGFKVQYISEGDHKSFKINDIVINASVDIFMQLKLLLEVFESSYQIQETIQNPEYNPERNNRLGIHLKNCNQVGELLNTLGNDQNQNSILGFLSSYDLLGEDREKILTWLQTFLTMLNDQMKNSEVLNFIQTIDEKNEYFNFYYKVRFLFDKKSDKISEIFGNITKLDIEYQKVLAKMQELEVKIKEEQLNINELLQRLRNKNEISKIINNISLLNKINSNIQQEFLIYEHRSSIHDGALGLFNQKFVDKVAKLTHDWEKIQKNIDNMNNVNVLIKKLKIEQIEKQEIDDILNQLTTDGYSGTFRLELLVETWKNFSSQIMQLKIIINNLKVVRQEAENKIVAWLDNDRGVKTGDEQNANKISLEELQDFYNKLNITQMNEEYQLGLASINQLLLKCKPLENLCMEIAGVSVGIEQDSVKAMQGTRGLFREISANLDKSFLATKQKHKNISATIIKFGSNDDKNNNIDTQSNKISYFSIIKYGEKINILLCENDKFCKNFSDNLNNNSDDFNMDNCVFNVKGYYDNWYDYNKNIIVMLKENFFPLIEKFVDIIKKYAKTNQKEWIQKQKLIIKYEGKWSQIDMIIKKELTNNSSKDMANQLWENILSGLLFITTTRTWNKANEASKVDYDALLRLFYNLLYSFNNMSRAEDGFTLRDQNERVSFWYDSHSLIDSLLKLMVFNKNINLNLQEGKKRELRRGLVPSSFLNSMRALITPVVNTDLGSTGIRSLCSIMFCLKLLGRDLTALGSYENLELMTVAPELNNFYIMQSLKAIVMDMD